VFIRKYSLRKVIILLYIKGIASQQIAKNNTQQIHHGRTVSAFDSFLTLYNGFTGLKKLMSQRELTKLIPNKQPLLKVRDRILDTPAPIFSLSEDAPAE
jgi:hypothetical protein